MKSSILNTMLIDEAKEKQFNLVESIAKEFTGKEFLNQGDLGVVPEIGRPSQTTIVQKVLAEYFDAESCALVRGAGTSAIRETLSSILCPGDSLFIHSSPIYKTTRNTIKTLGLSPIITDFNDEKTLKDTLLEHKS